MGRNALNPGAVLAIGRQRGLQLRVDGGQVKITAERPPDPRLLARLEEHRDGLLMVLEAEACLGRALRRVTRCYDRMEEPRPEVTGIGWDRIDSDLHAALRNGDPTAAKTAVSIWERRSVEKLLQES